MWCDFTTTETPGVHRCSRCGFTTAGTRFPPQKVRRQCQQWDPMRLVRVDRPHERGFGDTVARWIGRLSGGRLLAKHGCGCARRQQWLNRLFPYRRDRAPGTAHADTAGPAAPDAALQLLLRFPHGLGDAVQLTTVLLHLRALRPGWVIDVEAKPGAASVLTGLVRRTLALGRDAWRASDYDLVHTLTWPEPVECYRDSPSTKAERCLREVFSIAPRREWCRYHVACTESDREQARAYLTEVSGSAPLATGRFPVVLLHYQGNSARRRKNLDEESVSVTIGRIRQLGYTPVALDWESPPRSALARNGKVVFPGPAHPLWRGLGTGDGAMLAALVSQAALFVGIDSGPGHVAGAVDTPSVLVWTGHHPVHYFALAENVTHLVPRDHEELLRGHCEHGARFFAEHYQHRVYHELHRSLPRTVEEFLGECTDDVTHPWRAPARPWESRDQTGAEAGRLMVDGDHWVRAAHRGPDMVIVRDVVLEDCYRLQELRLRPRTILDVGAHIGCFAALAHRRWPEAELACVEANPANLAALRANAGTIARIIPAAATYAGPLVRLVSTVFPGTENTGGSFVWEDHANQDAPAEVPAPASVVEVGACTLEEIAAMCGWRAIDLLKLDCEGCELPVLEHAGLLDRIGVIVGECHDRRRFTALVARRMGDWELRWLTDGEPGLFWLVNPARDVPREE